MCAVYFLRLFFKRNNVDYFKIRILHMTKLNRKFTVAPMLDWTDRHGCLSQVADKRKQFCTPLNGDEQVIIARRILNAICVKSGRTPSLYSWAVVSREMAECARLAERYGYDGGEHQCWLSQRERCKRRVCVRLMQSRNLSLTVLPRCRPP